MANVTHDGNNYEFDSLSLVRIDLKNGGNRDIEAFTFGITLDEPHATVLCAADGGDRHHHINEADPKAAPNSPRNAVDFKAAPFNRHDRYTVKLYVRNRGRVTPDQIKLSTAFPVQFKRMQSLDEQYTKIGFRNMMAEAMVVLIGMAGVILSFQSVFSLPFFDHETKRSNVKVKLTDEKYDVILPNGESYTLPISRSKSSKLDESTENEATKESIDTGGESSGSGGTP